MSVDGQRPIAGIEISRHRHERWFILVRDFVYMPQHWLSTTIVGLRCINTHCNKLWHSQTRILRQFDTTWVNLVLMQSRKGIKSSNTSLRWASNYLYCDGLDGNADLLFLSLYWNLFKKIKATPQIQLPPLLTHIPLLSTPEEGEGTLRFLK